MSALWVLAISPCSATDISEILDVWSQPRCYNATAEYSIWMPQRDDAVKYTIKLSQRPPAGNSALMPCDYIIEWEYRGGETPTIGFSAYTDGHHYRFNGHGKINEYDVKTDSASFHAKRPYASVQRAAQFVSLLPAAAALEISDLISDTAWVANIKENTLIVEMLHSRDVVNRRRYTLGPDSLPISILIENNIGAISEQSVEVSYTPSNDDCNPVSEEMLSQRFPEQFAHLRPSNYTINNLEGQPLPRIALLTPTGERYLHNRGDGFRRPTIVALLDADNPTAPQTVNALRDAIGESSVPADLIFAILQPDIYTTEDLLGTLYPGEHHLMGARTWANDVGADQFPTFIVCNDKGFVTKVIVGENKDIIPIVIETLLNQ